MSDSFRALRLNKTDDGQSHEIIEMNEDALMDGDVTIAVSHSTNTAACGSRCSGGAVEAAKTHETAAYSVVCSLSLSTKNPS